MNSFLSLAKAFTAAGAMSQPMDKGQKIKVAVLSIFSVCFIFVPVLLIVGVLVKLMTESLMPLGFATFGIEMMLYVICFFSVVFGINVIFSEFYFANDIEFMLPWPLRAWQLVGARFVSVFFMENVMQFLFVVSCIVGYGLGAKMSIGGWILSVVGIVTLPILPLAYCGIVSILLMGLTRFIRNKDLIQRASVVIMFALLVVLVASIGRMQSLDLGAAMEAMATGDQTLFNVLGWIFPNVPLFIKTFSEGNLLALLGYVVVNVVAVAVMLLLAETLYFKSVVGLNSAANNSKTKSVDKVIGASRQRSAAWAYFMKEVRILTRTPAFLTNCVAINFLWPIFVYAMSKIAKADQSIAELQARYAANDLSLQLFLLLGVVGISVLLSSLNSISSNSISREGKHFSFMKYIPVPYSVQWNVKVYVAVMFSALGVLVFYIPVCILIKMPLWHLLLFVALALLSVLFVSYMGIYIDSIQPKLIWDDELNSLRENYNCFFSMAIAIAFVVVVCVGGYFLFDKMQLAVGVVAVVLFGILLVANAIVIAMTLKSGASNIQNQEET